MELLHELELLSEEQFAEQILKRSSRTARRLRAAGLGPRVTWVARAPYYSPAAIRDWLVEQERPPSARPPKPQPKPKALGAPASVRMRPCPGLCGALVEYSGTGRVPLCTACKTKRRGRS
jgi:hypothetical protein